MVCCPWQAPFIRKIANTGDGLGKPIAICGAECSIRVPIGRQLVGLVEDNEVVGLDGCIAKAVEQPRSAQAVYADDNQVTVRADEGVAISGVGPNDDLELQLEELSKLAVPVSNQARGGDDQYPPNCSARKALSHVEAGHDGLACAGIVGE